MKQNRTGKSGTHPKAGSTGASPKRGRPSKDTAAAVTPKASKKAPKMTIYVDGHPIAVVARQLTAGKILELSGMHGVSGPLLRAEPALRDDYTPRMPSEYPIRVTDGMRFLTSLSAPERGSVAAKASISVPAEVERVDFSDDEDAEVSLASRFKLTKDLKDAATKLTRREARFIVDAYYQMQHSRIQAGNQVGATERAAEPHAVLDWLQNNNRMLERQMALALDKYSASDPVGSWSRTVKGIGPVLAAALLAHIDIEKAPTVGHIWSFGGLNPTCKWEKNQKRPWNAQLKVVFFKIGESFVKLSNHEDSVYSKFFVERKKLEVANNDKGLFSQQAMLEVDKLGKTTDAYLWKAGCFPAGFTAVFQACPPEKRPALLEASKLPPGTGQPMLPPGQIHARARRYAVKLFLAAWHEVAFCHRYGTPPPKPYPIAHLGHVHKIEVPRPPSFVTEAYRKSAGATGR